MAQVPSLKAALSSRDWTAVANSSGTIEALSKPVLLLGSRGWTGAQRTLGLELYDAAIKLQVASGTIFEAVSVSPTDMSRIASGASVLPDGQAAASTALADAAKAQALGTIRCPAPSSSLAEP